MEAYRLRDEMSLRSEELDENLEEEPILIPEEDEIGIVLKESDIKNKEITMNMKKLNEAMDELKNNVGSGLLSSTIASTNDGQMIIGYNSHPKAAPLFTQITSYLNRALKDSGLEGLGKYYIVDMTNHKMGIVIPLGDFWWGLVTDSQKAPLGLLLNIAIPRAIDMFEEAMVG